MYIYEPVSDPFRVISSNSLLVSAFVIAPFHCVLYHSVCYSIISYFRKTLCRLASIVPYAQVCPAVDQCIYPIHNIKCQ